MIVQVFLARFDTVRPAALLKGALSIVYLLTRNESYVLLSMHFLRASSLFIASFRHASSILSKSTRKFIDFVRYDRREHPEAQIIVICDREDPVNIKIAIKRNTNRF